MQEIQQLSRCLSDTRLTSNMAVASAALIFYDWFLTSGDELKFMWRLDKRTFARVLFLCARYPALVGSILDLLPTTVTLGNVLTCLRLVNIVAAEIILATRTWAMWDRARVILVILVGTFIACIVPGIIVIERDIATTIWGPPVAPGLTNFMQCRILVSAVKSFWIVPYLVIILFESVVLSLTTYKVLQYYRQVPAEYRTHLWDILWLDGIIYFVFMLLLGIVNIGLVLQVSAPQLRSGGTQLQMVFHSIISTRIVLHISSTMADDISKSGCSVSNYRLSTIEIGFQHEQDESVADDVRIEMEERQAARASSEHARAASVADASSDIAKEAGSSHIV
ncbi:hypothetical protein BV25DRAFT_989238 [Artomyces pyxidatus]|uniref:Uncharacterized protein n=1 Tax=Artomyces pyxidatus TaxID=48021 RepID=A0ACB8SWG2_9AGAM|nr:hypothetical protein BV25DRAFT_989238 [Artomyces pyxidatus]